MPKLLEAVFLIQRVRPGRIKNGAALCEDARNSYRGELHDPLLYRHALIDEPLPSILNAHKAMRVSFAAVLHNCPNGCIESGTVSAAGEYADVHNLSLLTRLLPFPQKEYKHGKPRDEGEWELVWSFQTTYDRVRFWPRIAASFLGILADSEQTRSIHRKKVALLHQNGALGIWFDHSR